MGDVNLDFSKNPRFLVIPYGCAAIGAGVAMATTGGAAAIAIGAVAGAIALPAVAVGVTVGAFALLAGVRKGVKEMMFEASMIPLGMALVAMNCAKALFVTPFEAAWKWMKSGDDKKHDDKKPSGKAIVTTNPVKHGLNGKAAGPSFNANANAKPAAEAPKENKPVAPKPPIP
ncbi:MAG: hypothetical protein ACAH80_18840 [Alphaproteobacteria bacterium]